MDIYACCPTFSTGNYTLRLVQPEDWFDLLKVYSDPLSFPIFNSDNCTGNFWITTREDMENCIRFWLEEYACRNYVRWSILNLKKSEIIGTLELFRRTAQDFFDDVALLRLDLRSDHETEPVIREIMTLVLSKVLPLFSCSRIATKIPSCAHIRRVTLENMGFCLRKERLQGHDGKTYGEYYLLNHALPVYSGLLIKESIDNEDILDLLDIRSVELWRTENRPRYWTALSFTSSRTDLPQRLSEVMISAPVPGENWFVDLKAGNTKYIVLRNLVLQYTIGCDEEKQAVCDELRKRGIPDSQMNWSE